MRIHHVLLLVAAALAGCRPGGRADVTSHSGSDTVIPVVPAFANTQAVRMDSSGVATVTTYTDSISGASGEPPEPEPNDCRYVGERPRPRYGEPGFGQPYDAAAMEAGVPFRCRLRPQGPEARVVVGGTEGRPMGFEVFLPADAGRPVQALPLDNDERSYEGSDLLIGEDLNGDGWMDLRVFTYYGTAGQMSDVFRFDPAAQRFVPDTALPGMNVLRLPRRGCVGTSTKTSAWDHSGADYCWSGGTWVPTRSYSQEQTGDGRVIRTERERRDGRMHVVRVDTLPRDTP